MSSLKNETIGQYRVVEYIGAGGMGEVYRAVHTGIGREAAVKILTRTEAEGSFSERFLNEARIHARLSHEGIATLYEFQRHRGMPCLVMEYVPGRTLAECLRGGTALPPAEAVFIFQALAEALAYIHGEGVVHRDIKPSNVKITPDGRVKLLDFGIAQGEQTPRLTHTGQFVGTLQYSSPEQLRGAAADARSDVWALGVLFYEMVTGRLPFAADSIPELLAKIEAGNHPGASTLDPHIPRPVGAVIDHCLALPASSRFASGAEVVAAARSLGGAVSTPRLQTTLEASAASHAPGLGFAGLKRYAPLVGAGTLVAIALIAALFTMGGVDRAEIGPRIADVATGPPPAAAAAGVASATAEQRTARVLIDTVGGSAEVMRNGVSAGRTPWNSQEPVGAKLDLRLVRDGQELKRLELTVAETGHVFSYTLDRSR